MLVSLIQLPNRTFAADPLNINADAAILVEASTGKFYMQKMKIQHLVLLQ
ncbi:hypothetical protein ACI2OX_00045 [Bacillus sp. N9]